MEGPSHRWGEGDAWLSKAGHRRIGGEQWAGGEPISDRLLATVRYGAMGGEGARHEQVGGEL